MCRCTRGLFWRWCCPNLNQVSTFLSIGPVSELFDTPLYMKSDFSLHYTTYCNKIQQNSMNRTFTTGQKLNYWIFQIIRWYLHQHRILQVIVLSLLPHMDCKTNQRSIPFGNLHLLVQGHQGNLLCFCSLQTQRSWLSIKHGIKRCHNGQCGQSVLKAFLNGSLRSASVIDKAFGW
jgi:hypothetical protein